MRRLLLWDLDGTLLTGSGVSREAMFASVEMAIGRPSGGHDLPFDGKTDPLIARELLEASGVEPTEVPALARKVLAAMGPQTMDRRARLKSVGKAFPGARDALAAVREKDALSTVLTGNLSATAALKVETFELAEFLDLEVGAYGSDREVRKELVQVARDRVEAQYEEHFAESDIWVIGDTPYDFEAARANGVRCLLVATGTRSLDELQALDADAVFADLTDTAALVSVLTD